MAGVFKLCVIWMLVAVCAVDVSANVSGNCLACICEAVSASGCHHSRFCVGHECGLFSMTWGYWADGGKPTLNGISPNAEEAYSSCANDPHCAARAVKNYMQKFAKDCNNDGKIDCYDYMALHKNGVVGCSDGVSYKYAEAFKKCVAEVGL